MGIRVWHYKERKGGVKALELSRSFLHREIALDRTASRVIGLCCFTILTALGAYVRIPLPFTPVPITLQTFFVLLSGAVLGKKWGALSQLSYLLLGIMGLPVFTGTGAGLSYLFGPTGGYLLGFVAASWIVGSALERRSANNTSRITLAILSGSLAGIYLFGISGLRLFLQCNFSKAVALGFLPFIPGDIIKIISAVFIYGKIQKRCLELF
ncbi:MAG: biotin transporter BioY [Candidatus Omnitrophota bacterium]|nr:MAG: biotin transporter BioY [Candidatus Omnitrophota bacterium]